jgi:RimJ/RimL family protein N-acetyltransferase
MKPEIRLRDVVATDLTLFFAHQQDPEAAALAAFTPRDKPAFAEHWAKLLWDDTVLIQTVVAGGEVAGNVLSFNRDGRREVGYWIDRASWGRGVATAALVAFLRLEQTRPLYAGVAKHNIASIRVLQKCGFTYLRAPGESSDDAADSHFLLVLPATAIA